MFALCCLMLWWLSSTVAHAEDPRAAARALGAAGQTAAGASAAGPAAGSRGASGRTVSRHARLGVRGRKPLTHYGPVRASTRTVTMSVS